MYGTFRKSQVVMIWVGLFKPIKVRVWIEQEKDEGAIDWSNRRGWQRLLATRCTSQQIEPVNWCLRRLVLLRCGHPRHQARAPCCLWPQDMF